MCQHFFFSQFDRPYHRCPPQPPHYVKRECTKRTIKEKSNLPLLSNRFEVKILFQKAKGKIQPQPMCCLLGYFCSYAAFAPISFFLLKWIRCRSWSFIECPRNEKSLGDNLPSQQSSLRPHKRKVYIIKGVFFYFFFFFKTNCRVP